MNDVNVQSWMSWEGGVDLVALSQEGLEQPNVIVHIARMVHTPVGAAASGMVLIPGPDGQPQLAGFVSTSETVGRYFGPNIFAGTPFENAPVLQGEIEVEVDAPRLARVKVTVAGYVIESELRDFGDLQAADRTPGNLPFHDRSLEARAAQATLSVNGQNIPIIVPPVGMSGGPAAVWAPCGIYWR